MAEKKAMAKDQGRISVIEDSAIHTIPSLTHLAKGVMEGHSNSKNITKFLD